MRRLVCTGCGLAEDLDNPTGDIHRVQFLDLAPRYSETGPPDRPVEEDLCSKCRKKVRQEFFGESDIELMDMPLMKGA
jgi:hypothetical protein